jgi:CHAT domain-containing protein/tetratricopeptide (TPR) repeat protein
MMATRLPPTSFPDGRFARGVICYDCRFTPSAWKRGPAFLLKSAGALAADGRPNLSEPMSGLRTLTALSLGLAGAFLPACRERGNSGATVETAGSWRTAEPRLTSGERYVPCWTDADAPDLVPDSVCEAPPRPRQHVVPPVSGGGVRRGGSLLHSQDGQDLDRRARSLERAVTAEANDARAWSDLAATYLLRAERLDEPQDLARALAAADRAVELDPELREARFNQALALERLFLAAEAEQAWQAYGSLDRGTPWAAEARRRASAQARPSAGASWRETQSKLCQAVREGNAGTVRSIVRSHPQATREYTEREALGDWARAMAQGNAAAADRNLAVARAIGQALASLNGEHLIRDAVAVIDQASGSGDRARLRDLVEGHRLYLSGYGLYDQRNPNRAGPVLRSAWASLRRAGSPLAARVSFAIACNDHLLARYPQALARLERLRRDLADGSCPALLGHVLWMEALNHGDTGRMMEAVAVFEKASFWFQRAGERENVAMAEALLAQSLQQLGRNREAWRHVYRALRITPELRDPKLLAFIFRVSADSALGDGATEAALRLQGETLRQAAKSNPPLYAETLLWRALAAAHLGRRPQALADLQEAESAVERIGDLALRHRRQSDLAFARGTVSMDDDPRSAIAHLTEALTAYRRDGNYVYMLRAFLARARAYRLAGDDERAAADLAAGLHAYDRLGENPRQEDLRLSFLETTDRIFDEMIDLQAKRGRTDLVLAYADQARTRVLPGSVSRIFVDAAEKRRLLAAEPQALGLAEIRRRLPEGVTLVQFCVLDDRVLIGLISRRNDPATNLFEPKVPREQLERLVAATRTFQPGGDTDWRAASASLFDILVRPWYGGAGSGQRLVFIPDKVLHSLSFPSLVDRETGRFLLQDHPVAVTPSATLYVNALERERRGAVEGKIPPGLVIGDPAIDHARFPSLSALPASAAEARRIAALYGGKALTGAAATKEIFLARASRAPWIHFAGHSLVDERNTLLSTLLLAPSRDGDPGAVYAREIYSLKLPRARLVVLAACDSGRAYTPGGEGVTSLARAFLAAGAHTVVASLWDVDDRATSRLFYPFHRALLAGLDPADALREAQLDLIAHGDGAERSPETWGAFEVFGASAH